MSMRAQISLMFDDADLFENFIEPCKQDRRLNGIIIRCLSAYYYNQEVRNLVEGTSIEEANDGVEVQSQQSICDSIRAALLMQDFLATELQDTVDGGIEDIDNILQKTNDFATDKGVVKQTNSEYGSGILQLEVKNIQPQQNQSMAQSTPQYSSLETAIQVLLSAVGKLSNTVGNAEVSQMISACQVSGTPVAPQVVTETTSQIPQPQVPISEPIQQPIFVQQQEPVVETPIQTVVEEPVVEEDISVENEPEISQNVEEPLEDAGDSLRGLLDGVL